MNNTRSIVEILKRLQEVTNIQMHLANNMVSPEERKELEAKIKAIMPNASPEMIEQFVQANKREEVVLPQACRIDDPECLSCGS